MIIFGRSIGSWVIAIILAVLVFLFITMWPVPQLLAMLHLDVPSTIVTVIGLLLAACVLFGNYAGWATPRSPSA